MLKNTIMNWSRGKTLLTNRTRHWTDEEIKRNDIVEKSMIFSNFITSDGGRSRQLVCTANTMHPDYEKNANIIANAPAMLNLIERFLKISDLWLPAKKISVEHEDEAKALYTVKQEFIELIDKCNGKNII